MAVAAAPLKTKKFKQKFIITIFQRKFVWNWNWTHVWPALKSDYYAQLQDIPHAAVLVHFPQCLIFFYCFLKIPLAYCTTFCRNAKKINVHIMGTETSPYLEGGFSGIYCECPLTSDIICSLLKRTDKDHKTSTTRPASRSPSTPAVTLLYTQERTLIKSPICADNST